MHLEICGEQTDENVQFASILHKCGTKLSDIGEFLKQKATDITSAWEKATKSAPASTSKKVPNVPAVQPEKPKKHTHKHYYEIPIATPSETTVVFNEEISEVPKSTDDDRNTWHDPKKWKPMWTKQEVPSCSSNEE